MRIILVGRPEPRARVRSGLTSAGIDVVAEFDTLSDARAAAMQADATVLAGTPERSNRSPEGEEDLTPREIDVLELLTEGLSNKAIAGRLSITDQTVKFHIASILGKLGATNRTEAVRHALRRGLISL